MFRMPRQTRVGTVTVRVAFPLGRDPAVLAHIPVPSGIFEREGPLSVLAA